MNVIGLIPARYGSSRYRGKPLCDILGKPMIVRVYESAKKWNKWYQLYVATDDERIAKCCTQYNIPWIMTDIDHTDCLDRCAEAATKLKDQGINGDRYIIIQGDEPLFNTDTLDIDYSDETVNFYKNITTDEEINDINIVKVIVTRDNYAIYYSRFPVPHYDITTRRVKTTPTYYKQIGVYAFSYGCLIKYSKLESTLLEKYEGIGLNRFIENNIPIKMFYTRYDSVSVDTIADKYKIEDIIKSTMKPT